MRKAWLVLANGAIFTGRSFGAEGEADGEVVFNTSLTGYQEILTDPSYRGQIVTMTATHIGNVGVNLEDVESLTPQVRGLIVRDYCPFPSNWRSSQPLHRYLKRHNIVGLEFVDTRTITKMLREHGAMAGIMSTIARDPQELVERAQALPSMAGQGFVHEVTCEHAHTWDEGRYTFSVHEKEKSAATPLIPAQPSNAVRPRVTVIDYGVKQNILRCLHDSGATVTVVPASSSADEVLGTQPDGVLLSNGPGDPATADCEVSVVKSLLGKVPLFGICLGHQLLGRALGAQTFKLKFGHRGGNQPILDRATGRVMITSQNHGFAVSADGLPGNIEVTHVHLNDDTIAGLRSTQFDASSVQYHPEASPGPHDAAGHFKEFIARCAQTACMNDERSTQSERHA